MKPKSLAWMLALTIATVALAGCSDEPEEEETVIPGSISQEQVEELEERATEQFPRTVQFPGQILEKVDPIVGVFEGRLDPLEGLGVEWPDDTGPVSLAGEIKTFDLNSVGDIPEGQPIEVRLKLKWWGDPGSSVDMDIYVDVPGTNDGYDPTSDDESWNWNIVTKFRVVNTVNTGDPLLVGMHLQNAKNPHPDGVRYELHYEIHFPPNVLGPLVAYGVTVPDDASVLIFESEPVVGDEHVTSQIVVYDADDNLVIDKWHNDIASETYQVPIRGGGEYVIYAKYMHGGFLRVETDVQNPDFEARALTTTITETSVGSALDLGAVALSGYGQTGDVSVTGIPVDAYAYIRPSAPLAPQVSATMAVINDNGDYHVVTVTGQVNGDAGRIGDDYTDTRDWENAEATTTLAGVFTWGYTNNVAVGVDAGYGVIAYTR